MDERYASCGGSHAALVEQYMGTIKSIADHIHKHLPPGISKDSLVQSGVVGLLEAAKRYDTTSVATFSTFSYYRVLGEMVGHLRSLDWVSRSVRHWGRIFADADRKLEQILGRPAQDEEVADLLGLTLDYYHKIAGQVANANLLSLEELETPSKEEWRKEAVGLHKEQPFDPALETEQNDLRRKLAAAMVGLPERQRQVVELYYFKEMTLKEVGEALGVTEGRACQILKRTHRVLWRMMQPPRRVH